MPCAELSKQTRRAAKENAKGVNFTLLAKELETLPDLATSECYEQISLWTQIAGQLTAAPFLLCVCVCVCVSVSFSLSPTDCCWMHHPERPSLSFAHVCAAVALLSM